MALAPSREAFITCALTGAGDTTGRSDRVPVNPAEIAEAGIEAARAGAAVIHVHVRDPETGRPARRGGSGQCRARLQPPVRGHAPGTRPAAGGPEHSRSR